MKRFMDYTNFVRSYYRIVVNKLDKFEQYNGTFANLNYGIDIPNDKKHDVKRNCAFLPDYDININAETEYFEKFLEYYGTMNVDLNVVLLDKQDLVNLYNILANNENDEAILEAISYYVDANLEILVRTGDLA